MPIHIMTSSVWRECEFYPHISNAWRSNDTYGMIGNLWRPFKRQPPANYAYHTAYVGSNSTTAVTRTFTPSESTWYRIICIGASGNGFAAGSVPDSVWARIPNYGGGGGGSGGVAIGQFWLRAGTTYTITLARYASVVTDDGTIRGNAAAHATTQSGTSGGSATGGNIVNLTGYAGGNGGNWSTSGGWAPSGADGGNGGARGGTGGYALSGQSAAGGGAGGGARLPGDSYCTYIAAIFTSSYRGGIGGSGDGSSGSAATVMPSVSAGSSMKLYGGGSGGGGAAEASGAYGGAPSNGSPEAVIIEKGVY